MIRPHRLIHGLFCAALISITAGTAIHAQPQPCDSLNTATFSHTNLGDYLYSFAPVLPVGSSALSTEWAFLGEDFSQYSYAQQPQVAFPAEGDYMVCLNAVLLDDQQAACTSTHCELVPLPVDSACAGLQPAFTIGVQSGAITFTDQTVSNGPVQSLTWDFGDGSSSTEATPTHTYPGMGPYETCLTVTTANCTATACNWIYLGPANVPCDTLLHAAIEVILYERTVAVFDQSITSGMNSSIHWDFGDGGTAYGSPATHTYAEDGFYYICGSVALWGPLASDTCMTEVCQWINTNPNAASIDQQTAKSVLQAFPVPFSDKLTVKGSRPGAYWTLLDVLGGVRLSGVVPADSTIVIEGKELRPGVYIVRVFSRSGMANLRIVKER